MHTLSKVRWLRPDCPCHAAMLARVSSCSLRVQACIHAHDVKRPLLRLLLPPYYCCCCRQTAGCGKPVLLVHGFGASCGHYRKTIPFLAKNGYKVSSQCCLAKQLQLLWKQQHQALTPLQEVSNTAC